jgi:predicted DNA-binding transcriptional regulator YafY
MARTDASTSNIRLLRIFKIHHSLRSLQACSAHELAEKCLAVDPQVNARKIREDIQFLRDMGAPIPKGNKHAKFRYSQAFSLLEALEGVKTSETDEVIAYLNQLYHKAPKAAFLEMDKVFLAMEKRIKTTDALGDARLQFEKKDYQGQEYLSALLDMIRRERAIEFSYEPFLEKSGERTVFPVFLKEYNHRWYLIGYNKDTFRYENYALDRIVSLPRLSDWKPLVKELPDPATYFKDLIGVTMEGKVETTRVRVQKKRAFYIRTKPWHTSQREIDETERWIDFEWTIYQNRELVAHILELGADAEVLGPPELRTQIKMTLERAVERYGEKEKEVTG